MPPAAYVVKAAIDDPAAPTFDLAACRTMYRGKDVAAGDTVYLFASGAAGLVARGRVVKAHALPRPADVARWTPRVDLVVASTGPPREPLARADLVPFRGGRDRPKAELDFKLYRQATDKLVGITAETAAFLASFFAG